MSTTFPDLVNTNFPDKMDTLSLMSDITSEDLPAVALYYSYMNEGKYNEAQGVLAANPGLNTKIFNAVKFNILRDATIAIERYFVEELQTYLNEQLTYIGEYSATATYKTTNIISYNGEGFICRVASSVGVAPTAGTTTTNWAIIAKRGIQGVSGTGLAPRGLWNALTEYYADDCVAHRNALWQCTATNTNSTPDETNDSWLKLMAVDLSSLTEHIADNVIHITSLERENWNNKQNELTIDFDPTAESTNPVSSGGVFSALEALSPTPFSAGTAQPTNNSLLWIDTTPVSGGLKYFNGTAWVPVPVRYTT